MKMQIATAVLWLGLLAPALAYKKSYVGYQALETSVIHENAVPGLVKLSQDSRFDFWSTPRPGRQTVVMASPVHLPALHRAFRQLNLDWKILVPDVGRSILRERAQNDEAKRRSARQPREASYDRFMDYDEIMAFLEEVVAANPKIASNVLVATSTEGRMVHAVKISSGPGKKGVWVDCAIHAREWIAPPVCLKIIEEVIASPELQKLVDWYILPVANPDGYAYSWSDDRLWRKTRRPNPNVQCPGTDPNRNFPFWWNMDNNTIQCSETYPGDRVYSEPECQGMGDILAPGEQSGGYFILYIAMHSYGQMIIYPWGNTSEPAPNAPELDAAGMEAAKVIAEYRGTKYEVGPSGSSLYYTYGASDDFAYGVGKIVYSYTIELPGGDIVGFVPPPEDILPVVTETWPGVETLVRRAAANKLHREWHPRRL